MGKSKYILEVEDDFSNQKIIGFQTDLPNHQLAYTLNKNLQGQFMRQRNDLCIDDLYFPYFIWQKDEENFIYLIENKAFNKENKIENGLFSWNENPIFLIPEFGKATHIIVFPFEYSFEIEPFFDENFLLKKWYSENVNSLKSKHKLIF